jgi:hypothetical protein
VVHGGVGWCADENMHAFGCSDNSAAFNNVVSGPPQISWHSLMLHALIQTICSLKHFITHSFVLLHCTATTSQPYTAAYRLRCQVQQYEWGKIGTDSAVAQVGFPIMLL